MSQPTISCLARPLCYAFTGRPNEVLDPRIVSNTRVNPDVICCSDSNGVSTVIFDPENGANVVPDSANVVQITGDGGVATFGTGPNTLDIRDLRNWTPFVVGTNPQVSSEYSSIQTAVNDAAALAASSGVGQLVLVQSGAYAENVTVGDNVTIRGVDREEVTITGTVSIPATSTTATGLVQVRVNGNVNVDGRNRMENVIVIGNIVINSASPANGGNTILFDSIVTGVINMDNGGQIITYSTQLFNSISTSVAGIAVMTLNDTTVFGSISLTGDARLQMFGGQLSNTGAAALLVVGPMANGLARLDAVHISGNILSDTAIQTTGILLTGCRWEQSDSFPISSGNCQGVLNGTGALHIVSSYCRAQIIQTDNSTFSLTSSMLHAEDSAGTFLEALFLFNAGIIGNGCLVQNSFIRGSISVHAGGFRMVESFVENGPNVALSITTTPTVYALLLNNSFASEGVSVMINYNQIGAQVDLLGNKFRFPVIQTAVSNAVGTTLFTDGTNAVLPDTSTLFANAGSTTLLAVASRG